MGSVTSTEATPQILLFVETAEEKSTFPIIDALTIKMFNALKVAKRGTRDYKDIFGEGLGYAGRCWCKCGKPSHSWDYMIDDGFVTSSLSVHYLAYHREEIPEQEIEKVTALTSSDELSEEDADLINEMIETSLAEEEECGRRLKCVTFNQLYDFARQVLFLESAGMYPYDDAPAPDCSIDSLMEWAQSRGHQNIVEEILKRFPGFFEEVEEEGKDFYTTAKLTHSIRFDDDEKLKKYLQDNEITEISPAFLRSIIDCGNWDRARFLYQLGADTSFLSGEEKVKLAE